MKNLSFSILRLRNFRLLAASRVFAMMALQGQAIVVGWQIYHITKDPLMLGLIGLTEAVPAIICALFAGHIVDVGNPRKIYFLCRSILAANTFILFLFAGGFFPVAENHLIILIFSGIFLSGIARAFLMPSSFSLLAQIVTRKDIPAASAWMGSGFHVATIGGPALAGIIYGGYGPRGAWTLIVSLIFIGLFSAWNIKVGPPVRDKQKREAAVQSIKAGWKFILKNPVLLSIMTLDMFAVLFGGAIAMLPAFADQVLHTGSQGLGALRAAPAVGAVIMALFMAVYPMKRISAKRLLLVVAGFGISMIGFGLSHSFWLCMFFLALSGLFDSVSMVIRSTLMQWLTPDAMRGRVSSVNSMFIISSNEIGAFESGVAARFLGLVPSIVIGGTMTLLVVAATAILSPKFRKMVVFADESKNDSQG